MNPFSDFKPYSKHPSSEWPLFSDWLDHNLDLRTATQQYSIYAAWGAGLLWLGWKTGQYRKIKKLIPNSIVSESNQTLLANRHRQDGLKGIVYPTITTFVICCSNALDRNEDLDRSGERYRDYFTRATYAGLSRDLASALGKDIVLRSSTHAEGSELLTIALSNMVSQGVIAAPKFDQHGQYQLPESVQQSQTLKRLDQGEHLQDLIVVPGEMPITISPETKLAPSNI